MTARWLVCFDRDGTVETGQPPGPIPVAWVSALDAAADVKVYAHGNQRLCDEAGVAGASDLWRRAGYTGGALVGEPRHNILRLLAARHPEMLFRVCVDDQNLSALGPEGWTYFTPDEFAEWVRSGGCPLFEAVP